MSSNIHSFEPIINANSRILILGTLPSSESLKRNQYYANPMNQFWKIIYSVFGEVGIDIEYEKRIRFLLDHEIAIWDMFHAADREGSLDANIKNGIPNEIPGLLQNYTLIKRIILAGRSAEKAFLKNFPNIDISAIYVPSTSPACAKPFDEKIQHWKKAILDEPLHSKTAG